MPDPFKTDPNTALPLNRRPYDPEKDREWIRGLLTVAAMLLFAGVVCYYIYGSFHILDEKQWGRFKDALSVILPSVASVLGSALGFYFGSQKK